MLVSVPFFFLFSLNFFVYLFFLFFFLNFFLSFSIYANIYSVGAVHLIYPTVIIERMIALPSVLFNSYIIYSYINLTQRFVCVCVCMFACARARAHVCVCVCVWCMRAHTPRDKYLIRYTDVKSESFSVITW